MFTMDLQLKAAPWSPPSVQWLGRISYQDCLALQESTARSLLDPLTPESIFLLEHDSVFTIGRTQDRSSLGDPQSLPAPLVEIGRGGKATWHGPGQLVGYPIVSLATRKDLHAYLRFLEQVLINAVGSLGLTATRRPGLTGIWIGPRKVAALGVAVRRWITYHGFALNVNAHLPHFAGIVPCGIAATEGTVTSLHAELGHDLGLAAVQKIIAEEFQTLWPAFLASGEIPDQ